MKSVNDNNNENSIRFKVEDVRTITALSENLKHVADDFETEKQSREKLRKEMRSEIARCKSEAKEDNKILRDDIKALTKRIDEQVVNALPRWAQIFITFLIGVVGIETTAILQHFLGG